MRIKGDRLFILMVVDTRSRSGVIIVIVVDILKGAVLLLNSVSCASQWDIILNVVNTLERVGVIIQIVVEKLITTTKIISHNCHVYL